MSAEQDAHKGVHDKVEDKKAPEQPKTEGGLADHITSFHSKKAEPPADELQADFENMIKNPVQNDQLVLDPVFPGGEHGGFIPDDIKQEMDKHAHPKAENTGFIPPYMKDEMERRQAQPEGENGGFIPDYVKQEMDKHAHPKAENTGFIPPYMKDEMERRQAHPEGVEALSTFQALEQMKWGKGAVDIDPTISRDDPVQVMDKIDGYKGDSLDGLKNDLMKCMMTEAVLGKDGEGMKKIEEIAKQLGYDDKQILAMATEARDALEKMGVHTNMSVLNTFIGEHGGAAERSFSPVNVPMDEAPMGKQYNQEETEKLKQDVMEMLSRPNVPMDEAPMGKQYNQEETEKLKQDVMEMFSPLSPEKQKEVNAGVEGIEKGDANAVAKFLKSATPEERKAFYKELEKKGYKVKFRHGPISFGGTEVEETEIIPPPGPFGHAEHEIKIRETSHGSLGPKAPPPSLEVNINRLR